MGHHYPLQIKLQHTAPGHTLHHCSLISCRGRGLSSAAPLIIFSSSIFSLGKNPLKSIHHSHLTIYYNNFLKNNYTRIGWLLLENLNCSAFSVAKATLESQMSVRLSVCPPVTETPQPLRIAPIDHRAYQTLSLSTIELIDHWAYQPLVFFCDF